MKNVLAVVLLLLMVAADGQDRLTRQEYVEIYASLAMKEMKRTGIPASITLAQGCLESDNGNSRLAVEANNHFGIKCHDWTGASIRHDDDEKNECFRKYSSAYQSFVDHSEFLTSASRYQSLFELKGDDYRKWARGLEKAGYATSNQYAELLIRIIEDNELHRFDQMVLKGKRYTGPEQPAAGDEPVTDVETEGDLSTGSGTTRQVFVNNRVEYIIADTGDTPASVREEMDLYPWELHRYNDLGRGEPIEPGMIIYLQPKRWRAEKGSVFHRVEEDETLWEISQQYAVKLKRLLRYNRLDEPSDVHAGDTVWLRTRRPHDPADQSPGKDENQQDEEAEMEFEFDDR